ncbi:MAG: ABC transporter permease subunit [Magnetococcales bacterium]|nr:ABC transporter permease subunit [Magnetococcales bacterium]
MIPLVSPGREYWLGTDISGHSMMQSLTSAIGTEIVTLVLSTIFVLLSGLVLGSAIAITRMHVIRTLAMTCLAFWVTLPTLLVSLLLLIHFGAGQETVVAVIIFVLTPTQALYVATRIAANEGERFVQAKRSFGFSHATILRRHLVPFVFYDYIRYTLSRVPEILMTDLALNFFGLGAQPPQPSLGRLLFDGMGFLYAAWWTWVPVVFAVSFLFLIVDGIASRISED